MESHAEVVESFLGLFNGEVTAADKRLGVEHAYGAALFDGSIHQRLGVAGIVALVVTMSAVADHVDDDVLLELLSILEGEFGYPNASFRIVCIDVEDRRLDQLGYIGGVLRRASSVRCGRETQLVVDDQVNRAADFVAADL